MLWCKLYSALSAIEVLSVCKEGPPLNARGARMLRYLRKRKSKL